MLYDEFREGTGCRDNAYNFKVYKDLEIIYMNTDITKHDIYEYGKKLVNNDLTDEQKEWNREIDERVERLKMRLDDFKKMLDLDVEACEWWKDQGEEYRDVYKRYRHDVKYDRDEIKKIKVEIKNQISCKYV